MDPQILRQQNQNFAGTGGVSAANRDSGFAPAFRDEETGRIELARFGDGKVAPMHLICGLPAEWATEHDAEGDICRVKGSIVAGFVREQVFYTRDEVNQFLQAEALDTELPQRF